MKKKKNNVAIQILAGVICVVGIIIFGEFYDNGDISLPDALKNTDPIIQSNNTINKDIVDGELVVDFIDVGQGDSILIRQGEYTMLIDGGTSVCRDDLLNFLSQEGIDRFEYLIGTHAHEDHIGSLDDVVNTYDFDTILFPKVTATTKTFENLVLAVQNKDKKFTTPVSGTVYELGDATFEILAPNSAEYTSANDYSIVIKLVYGDNSFIFTGDAESESEKEIIAKGYNLKADVLKVGHHGSTTSTSKTFLDKVNPEYAVICVGKDNSYKHPTQTTMNKLKNKNILVYRTDEQGTIRCTSDGENITFNMEPGTYDYPSK